MSYWNRKSSTSFPLLDNTALSARHGNRQSITDEFYEIEPAIVLDIILDKNHSYFTNNSFKKSFKLNPDQWPVDVNGKAPLKTDADYTWVGRALVRLVYSQENVEKENLIWAMPLESNISEYPILNETVGVVFYLGQYYYTKKINTFNTVNAGADFNSEINFGGFRSNPNQIVQGNRELILNTNDPYIPYVGPPSKLNVFGSVGYTGALGRYFFYNPRIRSLKRREGDLVFESRFGQSIRFASYDDNRNNDKGYNSDFSGYTDYKGNGIMNPYSKTEAGGGNPMVLIRNRQRPLSKTTEEEKNVGGYLLEDINNDGSSIHLTSGVTLSQFQPTCIKKMWGNGSEEQPAFNGVTTFKYPQLNSDQMVLNSDRIVISAKKNEMFQYSKKRMSIVTDNEFTLDAQNQVVITTNNKTVLNSPAIYLGEYNQTNEPVLLGQTTVNWLYDLCNWLLIHTHWYKHTHPNVGQSNPPSTQTAVEAAGLTVLQSNLNLLMSRRVFVVGGGYAPGHNGVGAGAVSITVPSGTGVPGGWNGSNRKYSASEKQQIQTEITDTQTLAIAAEASATAAQVSSTAAQMALKTVTSLYNKVNDSVTSNALTTAKQQASLAKTNASLAAQSAATAKAAAGTATTTDNEILRTEKESEAKDAADKAKYYAGLADTQNKAAQSSVSVAQTEVTKVQTQQAVSVASR
jgi:hypothetical protein